MVWLVGQARGYTLDFLQALVRDSVVSTQRRDTHPLVPSRLFQLLILPSREVELRVMRSCRCRIRLLTQRDGQLRTAYILVVHPCLEYTFFGPGVDALAGVAGVLTGV